MNSASQDAFNANAKLLEGIEALNFHEVKEAIEVGANLDTTSNSDTLVGHAVQAAGRGEKQAVALAIILLLLRNGASPFAHGDYTDSPIYAAISYDQWDVIKILHQAMLREKPADYRLYLRGKESLTPALSEFAGQYSSDPQRALRIINEQRIHVPGLDNPINNPNQLLASPF